MTVINQFPPLWELGATQPEYNCSSHAPPGPEWSVRYGTRRPLLGAYSFTFGCVSEIVYALCMTGIWQQRKHSCYKIMLYLGVVDMLSLVTTAILPGVFFLRGTVYCEHPKLLYVIGACTLSFWCTACLTSLVLVINRISDFFHITYINHLLFQGNRSYYILALPTLYGLYFFLLSPPDLFNSTVGAYFFTPFIEGLDFEYVNYVCTFNNIFIVVVASLLYVAFAVMFLFQNLVKASSSNSVKKNMRVSILVQTCSISALNTLVSLMYIAFGYVPVPPVVVFAATITLQLIHAYPAFIYLVFNTTIRHGVYRTLHLKSGNRVSSHDNGSDMRRMAHPSY